MKKILLAICLSLFVLSNVFSQKPFYHKNKTISWVGETEFTYYLENYDRLNFEPNTRKQEETRTIKIDPVATCEFGNEKYFTNFIINEVIEGNRKVFSLKGKQLTLAQIQNSFGAASMDSTYIIDPDTGDKTLMVIRSDPKFQINAFKVRQWWFYDKEKESLGSMVRAIAPIIFNERDGEVVSQKTLFWIEMHQDPNKNYSFNDPSVIWAKETLSTLSFDKVKRVKGRTKKTLKNLTYNDPKNGKIKILENDSWYPYCAEEIGKEEVAEQLQATVDTIVTYDPGTYEEQITIVKNKKVKYKNFDYFRVLQHWFFDKSTNTLASKVISIGPLKDVTDELGNLKYRRALYYIPSK